MRSNKLQRDLDNYKTYVFDCDGVLIDSNRTKTDAFYQVALEYGQDIAEEFSTYHKNNGGVSRQEKFKYLFCEILKYPDLPKEAYDKALDEYARHVINGLTNCDILPGVREFIENLPKDSKKYVVSGGAEEEVRWVLKLKGLAQFFDGVYGNPIDKMNLVLNLKLEDKDYPGIFFGDARYDHEVALRFNLAFVFLSGVSEFSNWKNYTQENNIVVSESFSDFVDNTKQDESILKGKAYFFGFPYCPNRMSNFSGGSTAGPKVIESFLENSKVEITLFSDSANYYSDWSRVRPVNQKIAFWDSAIKSNAGLSAIEIGKYQSFLPTLYEMIIRNRLARRNIFRVASYQILNRINNFALNKVAFWKEGIENDNIQFYINSNVPHLSDDFACYSICRDKGIPTAFPYRMPIVPGVSTRLYIPESLYNHGTVYDGNGVLVSYNREAYYGDKLPDDLQVIYDKVVLGNLSLGECSKAVLEEKGTKPPSQHTPAKKGLPFFENIKKNIINKFSFFEFSSAFTAFYISHKNQLEYEKLSSKVMPDCPFIYYALHMQPEASSSPLGGCFSEQLRAVRFLSSRLPKGWKVIVKEHPHQKLEERSLDLYSELAKTNNVELIDMEFSSDLLQEKSIAVATLTGTSALEAWLKGRPAIVMGNILFQGAPGIYKISSNEEADIAFAKIKSNESHSKDDIYHYLKFLGVATFFGYLDAYIDPSIPSYDLDPEENEKEIARRLIKAITTQTNAKNEDDVNV